MNDDLIRANTQLLIRYLAALEEIDSQREQIEALEASLARQIDGLHTHRVEIGKR